MSAPIRIDDRCSGCGSCITTCPTAALFPSPGHPTLLEGACHGCLACVEVCPADAITIVRPQ